MNMTTTPIRNNSKPVTKALRKSKPAASRAETFAFHAPAAAAVLLAGDFTRWQEQPVRLQRDANGTWQGSVILAPGRYLYRFIVDGQWQDEQQLGEREASPFGSFNAVRQVL